MNSEYVRNNKEKVSSKEYIDWVYTYVSLNKRVDDESALYVYKGIDAKNGQLLSWFVDYVQRLAKQQNVPIMIDRNCTFANELIAFKIRDKYFEAFTMFGQGAWSSVSLLDKAPEYGFVNLGDTE